MDTSSSIAWNGRLVGRVLVFLLILTISASSSQAQGPAGPEVLSRGPIHEAFAAPVVFNPTPGVVVPKPPPSSQVEELPPDQKPEGSHVDWIPGYWAWDDERNDYLWISGIWRDLPPGRQWVPGYWGPVGDGYRWTSGFWSPTASNGQLNYLPAPPQSLEAGPNVPQPSPDWFWSPGSWVWNENRFVWRPGYWVQSHPEWIWVPPSYAATPGGYVYIDGYWDYPPAVVCLLAEYRPVGRWAHREPVPTPELWVILLRRLLRGGRSRPSGGLCPVVRISAATLRIRPDLCFAVGSELPQPPLVAADQDGIRLSG
jgi:hypothetical protein